MTSDKKIDFENLSGLVKRDDLPSFSTGDTLKVHCKIKEGNKERVQIFEGIVIKMTKKNSTNATFTVRKVSYNIGVERTFFLYSPRIEKIELMARGKVRRARLFYLRALRGKAARIENEYAAQEKTTKPDSKNSSSKKESDASVEAQASA